MWVDDVATSSWIGIPIPNSRVSLNNGSYTSRLVKRREWISEKLHWARPITEVVRPLEVRPLICSGISYANKAMAFSAACGIRMHKSYFLKGIWSEQTTT